MRRKIVCFLLLTVFSIGLLTPIQVQAQYVTTARWEYSNWMETCYDQLKNKTLNEICLPATHDSGTYGLKIFVPEQISDQISSTVLKFATLPGIKDIFRDIVEATSITQEADIYTQLTEGIRSFDIRFKVCKEDGEFRIFHGMFGDTFEEITDQFLRFMNEHPNEFIYIRFNCAGEMWDFNEADKRELGQKFMDVFGDHMVGPEDGIIFHQSTFEDVISTGKRVMVHCLDDTVRSTMQNTFADPDLYDSYVGGCNIDATVAGMYQAYETWDNLADEHPSRFETGLAFSFAPDELCNVLEENLSDPNIYSLIDGLKQQISLELLNKRARGKFYNVFQHIGEEGNKPIAFFTSDFYARQYIELAILRNLGKNKEERYEKFIELEELYNQNPNDTVLTNQYEFFREIRLRTMDLEAEFVDTNEKVYHMPYGGNGGQYFEMFKQANPVKVTIETADRVDAIGIQYDNGEELSTGGNGGNYKEMILDADEYITHVILDISNRNTIGYIEFRTNKGQILAGGEPTNNDMVFEVPVNWQVVGFYGRSADEIDQLGMICKPIVEQVEYEKLSDSFGGEGGSPFNFITQIPNDKPRILFMRSADRIDKLGIQYNDKVVLEVGGSGGAYQELCLDDNEYITEVTLSLSKRNTIGYASFKTNKNRVLSGGKQYAETMTFTAPEGYHIIGFYGRCADEVDKLGCIYRLVR